MFWGLFKVNCEICFLCGCGGMVFVRKDILRLQRQAVSAQDDDHPPCHPERKRRQPL